MTKEAWRRKFRAGVEKFRDVKPADDSLAEERRKNWKPFIKPPFDDSHEVDGSDGLHLNAPKQERWTDLLLDVAMTTTFASLNDGTPIMRPSNILSYIAFFVLVWWTWASQIAYNVRFRQPDWIHRFFVFLQLLVFAGMAAFTNQFDITVGFDAADEMKIRQLQLSGGVSTPSDLDAGNFRADRLMRLNVRGLSMVVALGRLILLIQYALVLYHARRARANCTALYVHIGTLTFTIVSYMVTFSLFVNDMSDFNRLTPAKLTLWYMPIVFEVCGHFVANKLPGRAPYNPDEMYNRSATVFVIILGGGLDKITNTFQHIFGNVKFDSKGVAVIFCAVVIFAAQFSLYFGTSEKTRENDNCTLAWFFSHFFYLSALIVTLQAISALVVFGNLGVALSLPLNMTLRIRQQVEGNPGVPINRENVGDVVEGLREVGVSPDTIINFVNLGISENANMNVSNTNLAMNYVYQASVTTIGVILQNFDVELDLDTVLGSKLARFLYANPENMTLVNYDTYVDVSGDVYRTLGQPSLWFYPAAGITLALLVGLSFIVRRPRDVFEWCTTATRLTVAFTAIALTTLDVNSEKPIIHEFADKWYSQSRIWRLAIDAWVLPSFAIMIILEQLVELALYILAGREHRRDSSTSNEIRLSDLHGSEHGDSTVDLTSRNSADLESLENNKQYRDSRDSLPSMDEQAPV